MKKIVLVIGIFFAIECAVTWACTSSSDCPNETKHCDEFGDCQDCCGYDIGDCPTDCDTTQGECRNVVATQCTVTVPEFPLQNSPWLLALIALGGIGLISVGGTYGYKRWKMKTKNG